MRDFIKWVARTLAIGVIWVFVLSIDLRGEMLFHQAHNLLIQNRLVQAIDQQMMNAVSQLKDMARTALSDQKDGFQAEQF